MSLVLDASSLLAFLHDEPGADRVWPVLSGAMVCAVNWPEVVHKSLRRQADSTGMRNSPRRASASIPFTHRQAEIAARL